MWIMVIYILIVVVFEVIVVWIGLALDRTFPSASLPVSLTLFFVVLWVGEMARKNTKIPEDKIKFLQQHFDLPNCAH